MMNFAKDTKNKSWQQTRPEITLAWPGWLIDGKPETFLGGKGQNKHCFNSNYQRQIAAHQSAPIKSTQGVVLDTRRADKDLISSQNFA